MRARGKLKDVDAWLDRYGAAIERDPAGCAGRWADAWMPAAREVRLDLGCGKGSFTCASAMLEPDVLFVGVDCEPMCIARAAQLAVETGVGNVVFVVGNAGNITETFGPGELSLIYLNFSTPYPRTKHADRRLTYVDRLMTYRDVLASGGAIRMKTDNQPLFDFSLTQLEIAGYELVWSTRDLHAMNPSEVRSGYEERLSAEGASIHAFLAKPGPRPQSWEQTAPLRLADYLPEDLSSLTYIPLGMEGTVENAINHERREANRERARQRELARARERARKHGDDGASASAQEGDSAADLR